ncbi:MAG: hypothetical protein ACE5GV_12475 [Candidatus Scalindua sp.]
MSKSGYETHCKECGKELPVLYYTNHKGKGTGKQRKRLVVCPPPKGKKQSNCGKKRNYKSKLKHDKKKKEGTLRQYKNKVEREAAKRFKRKKYRVKCLGVLHRMKDFYFMGNASRRICPACKEYINQNQLEKFHKKKKLLIKKQG